MVFHPAWSKYSRISGGKDGMKMKVPVDSIQINSGRRETDRRHIGELAASMAELGLLNPITIDQGL